MKLIKLLSASTLMLIASAVYAETATVGMGESGCGLFDGDGNVVDSDQFQWVINNNARGNGKLTCHAYGVVNNAGRAVHWDFDSTGGGICGTPAGGTTRWRAVVSDLGDGTGDATLSCKTP